MAPVAQETSKKARKSTENKTAAAESERENDWPENHEDVKHNITPVFAEAYPASPLLCPWRSCQDEVAKAFVAATVAWDFVHIMGADGCFISVMVVVSGICGNINRLIIFVYSSGTRVGTSAGP